MTFNSYNYLLELHVNIIVVTSVDPSTLPNSPMIQYFCIAFLRPTQVWAGPGEDLRLIDDCCQSIKIGLDLK